MTANVAALRLLAYKRRSVTEIRKKLTLKGFSPKEIDEAISFCRPYLNDEEEAKRRTEGWKRRGLGPRLIAYRLREAGLKPLLTPKEEQVALIRELLQKPTWAKKPRQKLIAALVRRGFDLDVVLESISHVQL